MGTTLLFPLWDDGVSQVLSGWPLSRFVSGVCITCRRGASVDEQGPLRRGRPTASMIRLIDIWDARTPARTKSCVGRGPCSRAEPAGYSVPPVLVPPLVVPPVPSPVVPPVPPPVVPPVFSPVVPPLPVLPPALGVVLPVLPPLLPSSVAAPELVFESVPLLPVFPPLVVPPVAFCEPEEL